MFIITGINHVRSVGICKKEGKAYDFNPENAGGYRSPQTAEEKAACIAKALEYYNICVPWVRTGDFGIVPISEGAVEEIGDALAEESLAELDADDIAETLSHLRTCRYCGSKFVPNAPRQEVCKNPACQTRRQTEKTMRWRKKQKNSPR